MGRSDEAGETLVFLEMLSPTSLLAVGSEAAGDFPARGPGWAAMGIGGSIPGSDVLFLTLEPSSPGVRALTCLSSGCKGHPLSSSHAVHAAFSVGVYINVLALIYIPKKFQGTIVYVSRYIYERYIYGNETISIRNTASVIELFLRILFFFVS